MSENIPIGNPSITGKRPAEGSAPKKMSFASVAAMAPKATASQAGPGLDEKTRKSPVVDSIVSSSPRGPSSEKPHRDLIEPMSGLGLKDGSDQVLDSNDQDIRSSLPGSSRLDDEKTHLSVSSTKAPSLDGKSVASGTIFEKESIRPEDSASVKAAEDEDSNSGPGSGTQNSQMGSEAGGKAFHNQLQEISAQRSIPLARQLALANVDGGRKGVIQPSGALNVVPPGIGSDIGMPIVPQYQQAEPDLKLLEALQSPKDRLFLLQLEQQFIAFIQDTQQSTLDLPPCNSFCRLLAHRLGDYYRLPHFVDNSVTSVRLYKTQNSQLPTPLSAFNRNRATEELPTIQPSMKIMRRAGMGINVQTPESEANTASSSVGASKPSSEAGEDGQKASGVASPTESMIAKDKASQSREEREAKYKEARDRIFADWKEEQSAEALQISEALNDASRTSSTNGKKKKKNKTDDEFQARSAFSMVYSNSVQQAAAAAAAYDQSVVQMNYYTPYMQNSSQTLQPGYPQPYAQQFPQMGQMQNYPQVQPQGLIPQAPVHYPQTSIQQPYMNYPQQLPQLPGQYYPQLQQQPQMLPPQHSVMSSPALSNHSAQLSRPQSQLSDQNWGQHSYQSPYQGFGSVQSPYQSHGPSTIQPPQMSSVPVPYQYGQLPFQPNTQGGRAPHPVPGSYKSQNFNPQTRSFVPGLGNIPTVPNTYNDRLNPSPAFQGMNMPASLHHPQMGSNFPPHFAPPSFPGQGISSPRKVSHPAPRSSSPGQSTLSKWGTPSTLPPKPPPPASPRVSSNGSTLGAQSMPTFQNGTYSKPSISPQEAKAS